MANRRTMGIKIGAAGLLLACVSFLLSIFVSIRVASPVALVALAIFALGLGIQLFYFFKSAPHAVEQKRAREE
ncbi:MAG: hypothetical protein ABL931_16255 [Usitatibacteraceae bacterium]